MGGGLSSCGTLWIKITLDYWPTKSKKMLDFISAFWGKIDFREGRGSICGIRITIDYRPKKSENCSILYQAYWEKNLQGGCCGIKITINYRPKKSENSLDIMGAYRDRKIARYYSCVLRWSSAKKVEKLIDIIGAYSDRNRRWGGGLEYLSVA